MSKRKKQSIKEASSDKKAAVLESKRKRNVFVPYIVISLCSLLVIVVAVFFFQKNGKSSENLAQTREITHPVKLFDEGEAKHFQFQANNDILIKYFVLKSSDGVIRAAFDACDVCWSSGKGYYQEGDYMVCRNCGRRFASVKINEVKGGCNPAPLNRSLEGDKLVIQVKDILEGKEYFDFSGRRNS